MAVTANTPAATPASEPVEGMWDRRRRLVALEIEQVALGLFAEEGYDNVTTDDIARACGMSVRTFFRYFGAKRDVLLAVPRRSLAVLCEMVATRPADEPLLTSWRRAAIESVGLPEVDLTLIMRVHAITLENPGLAETIQGDPELTERFVQTNAHRLGVDPAGDLRPGILAGAVRSALITAMEQWSSGRSKDLATSFADAFDVLDGLAAIAPAPRPRRRSPKSKP